jgi:hypothetical protein
MRCRLLLALPLLLVAVPARGDDLKSGPDKGAKVPELKVYDATGEHKEKDVDYAAERKDKPTVYLFIDADKFGRPMHRFVKGLDEAVKKDFEGAYIVAVWLTDDADAAKKRLPEIQGSAKYEATAMTVFADKDKAGPKGWNINSDAHLTAVVVNKGKVAATFAYQSINETDVPKVKEALEKAVKGK